MSIWLPQASRHVHRVTALHATRSSLKYAASDLAYSRLPQRQFVSSLNYYNPSLFTPYLPPHSRTPAACRSYATSNTEKDAAPSTSNTETNPPSTSNVPAEPAKPLGARIWAKVKHEAAHYWHGSKLLVSEMRISLRLVFLLLQGKTLTRREKRQLRRTTTDLLRLIPFSVFIIVPFMELLLPVAIKLSPICYHRLLRTSLLPKKSSERPYEFV